VVLENNLRKRGYFGPRSNLGWMDGWMDGWMGRWMGGWVDGWMSTCPGPPNLAVGQADSMQTCPTDNQIVSFLLIFNTLDT
jgi:hypothetical protein